MKKLVFNFTSKEVKKIKIKKNILGGKGANLVGMGNIGFPVLNFNVKKIQALGEDFNANYHQAMFEKETNEFEGGKVCEIVQDGYTFHDRLLRPVLVGVAKKSNENNEDEKIEDNENIKNEEKN